MDIIEDAQRIMQSYGDIPVHELARQLLEELGYETNMNYTEKPEALYTINTNINPTPKHQHAYEVVAAATIVVRCCVTCGQSDALLYDDDLRRWGDTWQPIRERGYA